MKSWKRSPKNTPVAKYVESYWFLEKEQHDTGANDPKLNPDPCTHLILSSRKHHFHYEHNRVLQKGQGSHWIFPHLKLYTMDHTDPFQIIGIKFKAGALYSFKSLLPEFKLNTIEPFESSSSEKQLTLNVDDLLEHSMNDQDLLCAKLDEILEPWLLNSEEDKHSELVRDILQQFECTPIAQMGSKLHRSQRTIERSFLKVTNFTLKQYQSMLRLEGILDYLYKLQNENVDWSELALKFNFSDQPHLIRYLKASIGKTPGEYTKQRDLTIDIYGNFDSH